MSKASKDPGHAAAVEAMIARLQRGRVLWRDVRWPGGDLVVRLRVLSTGEMQEAEAAAYERIKEIGLEITALTLDTLAGEKVTQILYRAAGDPARPVEGRSDRWHPIFESAAIMRDVTWPEERAAVWVDYEELRVDCDPAPDEVLDEDTLADIEEALKKRSARALALVGSWRLASYLLTTAGPPSSSPISRSTSSSESESSSDS